MSLVFGTREIGRSKLSKCCDSRPVVFSGSFDWISTASKPLYLSAYTNRGKPILISGMKENTFISARVVGIRELPISGILFMEGISKIISDIIQSVTIEVIYLLPLRKNLLMHEYAFAFTSASAHPLSIDNPSSFIANEWAPSKLGKFIVVLNANTSNVSLRKWNKANRWIARLNEYRSWMWSEWHSFTILPKIVLYHGLESD